MRLFLLPILLLFTLFVMPNEANAQILGIELNSLGNACVGGTSANNLFNNRTGDIAGDKGSVCQSTRQTMVDGVEITVENGLFERFFCIMETTLGLVISRTFCAIRDAWLAPFGAMLLLLMGVTGISFALGITEFTVKEVSALIFKIGLVALFVMNADIALDLAFGLYLAIMKSTVGMMGDGFINIANTTPSGDPTPYASAASVKGSITQTVGQQGTPGQTPFSYMDGKMNSIMKSVTVAKSGSLQGCSVFSLLLVILFLFPFAMMVVLFALVTFAAFFARAAYGYIYALVMVTFLIAAMPIFVSFALFKTTSDLFEHWLKYIGSNVIQIFIVFAIMAFASMVDFIQFLDQINSLIVPYNPQFTIGNMIDIPLFTDCWFCCSICKPAFVTNADFPGIPLLRTTGAGACESPEGIPWMKVLEERTFFKFLFIHGMALYILTKVMEVFMREGPDMARMLGGARLVHVIGGQSASGGQAVTSALHRGSVNFEQGFKDGWEGDDDKKSGGTFGDNVFTRTKRAIEQATSSAVDDEFDDGTSDFENDKDAQAYIHNYEQQRNSAAEDLSRKQEQSEAGETTSEEVDAAVTRYHAADKAYNQAVHVEKAKFKKPLSRDQEAEKLFGKAQPESTVTENLNIDGSKK